MRCARRGDGILEPKRAAHAGAGGGCAPGPQRAAPEGRADAHSKRAEAGRQMPPGRKGAGAKDRTNTLQLLPSPLHSRPAQVGAAAHSQSFIKHQWSGKVPQSVHKFLYSEFLAGSGRRLRLLTGARPRASGVPTACMRCARRGDGIPSPSVRRAQAPAALAPRGPSVQPEGLAACRAVRAPMRSAHGERLRRPEPTVSEAARGAAQSACSQISAPVLAYSTRNARIQHTTAPGRCIQTRSASRRQK